MTAIPDPLSPLATLTGTPSNATASSVDLRATIEVASKSVALLAGAAYFLGLLVVNFWLRRYGADFLGFFAVPYLAAGICAMYPLAAGGVVRLFFHGIIWSTEPRRAHRWFQNSLRVLALGLAVGALCFGVPFLLGVRLQSSNDWLAWVLVFILAAIIFAPPDAWKRKPSAPPLTATERWFIPGLYSVLGLFMVAFYAQLFSAAYGTIPGRWGGGEESAVHVVLSPEIQKTLMQGYGFSSDSAGLRASLLLLTDQFLLIAPRNSLTAVLLRRENVKVLGMDNDLCRLIGSRDCRRSP